MNALQASLDFVLPHEGGLSLDPDDPGLATRFGISLRFLRKAGFDLGDIDGDGDIDADDILALTEEDAVCIYRDRFWTPLRLNSLPARLAVVVMDTAINMGPGTAVRLLQETLNSVGALLKTDGILGAKTRRAVEVYGAGAVNLIRAYLLLRVFQYNAIVDANKKLLKFLVGWLNRVEDLEQYVTDDRVDELWQS
jgi:lysozyme family protein